MSWCMHFCEGKLQDLDDRKALFQKPVLHTNTCKSEQASKKPSLQGAGGKVIDAVRQSLRAAQ